MEEASRKTSIFPCNVFLYLLVASRFFHHIPIFLSLTQTMGTCMYPRT